MPPKRSLEVCDSSVSQTPSRGPKRRQLCSPLPPSSPFSPSSSLATPRTPACTWTVPADSPTNPFGRIRRLTHGTTLPRPTSFSKHLPLRFQLVHPNADGRGCSREGVYRIIQVPLSYTLAHLRKLIAYMFNPATDDEITVPYNLRRSSAKLMRALPSQSKGKVPSLALSPVGHLFEVQREVELDDFAIIKEGHTWVKSSAVQDPYHYPGNDPGDTLFLDEGDEWRWDPEEDFQLTKVWSKGCDITRAIKYHHDSRTQIHITVNKKKIPPRKGVGNKPFLFLAYGSLSLSDPKGTLCLGTIETTRWNRIGAYERFLKAEAETDRATRGAEEDIDEDIECELDPDTSSTLPIFTLSSSPFLTSESSNPVTPFPAEPSLRRRVDYEHRRLLKITKAGMKDAGLSDEEENEVNELVKDVGDDVDPAIEEKPRDWDPFLDGDEIC